MVIDKHALEATGGLRYAELDREDPKRETAKTASFLQSSLFTSVVAFGVAAMAIAVGVLFIPDRSGDQGRRPPDQGSRQPHPRDRMSRPVHPRSFRAAGGSRHGVDGMAWVT